MGSHCSDNGPFHLVLRPLAYLVSRVYLFFPILLSYVGHRPAFTRLPTGLLRPLPLHLDTSLAAIVLTSSFIHYLPILATLPTRLQHPDSLYVFPPV